MPANLSNPAHSEEHQPKPAGATLFEAEQLVFAYDGTPALNGLTMTIRTGEKIALLGANGSGKSTLLRLLDALHFADSGTLRFCKEVLSEDRFADDTFAYAFRRRVGFVFQNADAQLFSPTVFEELAFGPLQLRLPQDEVRRMVNEALDQFEISHLAQRAPHRLSGGEKKKVALASVLIMKPDVILLDEPTAGLDPRSQTHLVDLLMGWTDQTKTIITATHDLHMLEDLADTCQVLERGRVICAGPTVEVLGDRGLLERANLVHSHRRARESKAHTHPGLHSHPH
ncbi:MAG: ABC transporter ATP-binding protein [Bryobacteraceae bacterium]